MSYHIKTVKSKLGLNNAETAFLIFKWLTDNIKYDCYNVVHDRQAVEHKAPGTFKTGVGVCSGYSLIFEMWGKALGLDAIYVVGYSKALNDIGTYSTQILHAWNIVKIDGVQYLIDSTWGAGGCNGDQYVKKYKEIFFCQNPEHFIRRHYPMQNSNYQLLNTVVSTKKFANMVVLSNDFYENGFKTISPNNAIFTMKGSYNIDLTFEKGKDYSIGGKWGYNNGNQFVEESKHGIKSSSGSAQLQILPKKKMQYELRIYGGPANQGSIPALVKYLQTVEIYLIIS